MKNNKAHLFIAILFSFLYFLSYAEQAEASVIVRPPNNLGLVGYWSFDEGRGTQAGDLSGNGNDGTLMNTPTWTSGKNGGGLLFGGGDQYVATPNLSSYKTSASTMSVWVNPEVHNNNRIYSTLVGLDGEGANPDNGYHSRGGVRINTNGTLYAFMQSYSSGCSGTSVTVTSPGSMPLNEWTHVSVVMEFTPLFKLTLYVNGEEQGVSSHTASCGNDFNWLWIGRRKTNNDMVGKLDEMRVYNRALSQIEIQSLYNNTKSTVVGEVSAGHYSDGLVAHYSFDGSTLSGSTVGDVAGSNDGTIQGGVVATIGRIGQGMRFINSGDYVQLPPSLENILNGIPEASLSMWVKLDSDQNNSSNAGIIQLSGYTSSNGNLYYYTDATREGGIWLDIFRTTRVFTGDWQPTFRGIVWHNLVITTTPGVNGWKMYLNGDLSYQTTGEAQVSVDSSLFGGFRIGQNSGGRRLGGVIDDVRIYNRALSAEEVRGLAGGALGVLNVTSVLGSILHERWEGIGGTAIANIPVNDPPDYIGTLTSFEIPSGWGDNYGSRLRGYLYPETTGNYTFWFASDDNGELWLSSDANPANKVRIANVATWTSSRQWNKEVNQKSVEIPLVAGQKYYIEGLMKEGGGGDNMAVSWKLNDTNNPTNGDGTFIIPGSALSPWVE